jgi:hypothetical protein
MALGTQRKVTGEIFDFALALQCKKPWQKETSDPLSKCLSMTISLRKYYTCFSLVISYFNKIFPTILAKSLPYDPPIFFMEHCK